MRSVTVNFKAKFKTAPKQEFEIKLPRFAAKTGQNQSLLRTTLAITVISSSCIVSKTHKRLLKPN